MAHLNPVLPIISLLFILPLIAFWLVMFDDMLKNDYLPALITRDAKTDWTLVFIFMNVFAAVFYYSIVYRNKR